MSHLYFKVGEGASKSCHAAAAGLACPTRSSWCARCCLLLHGRRQGCCFRSCAISARTCASTSGGSPRAAAPAALCSPAMPAPLSVPSATRPFRSYPRPGARRSPIASSHRPLFSHARTTATCSAPDPSQIIPAPFSRALTSWLQPLSTLPLPICSPRARYAA